MRVGQQGRNGVQPAERDQGFAMAQRLSMQTLTRTWTLLLKSLAETRDAPLAIQAAEMAIATSVRPAP